MVSDETLEETTSDQHAYFVEYDEQTDEEDGAGDLSALIAEFEQHDSGMVADARRWVKEALYPDEVETVRSVRLSKGLSQVEVAQRMSTHQSHVARIESGDIKSLYFDTVCKLAEALEVESLDDMRVLLNNQKAYEDEFRG